MIIGSELIFCKNLPSTNTRAAQLIRYGNVREGTIIYTNFQTAGRGQSGNKWESEDGKNLLISIILFPFKINPSDQFYISMAITLGICDFVKRYIPACKIKWPNDIYVNNDKIAGLLIENSIMGSQIENTIAGIGLNINQDKFLSGAPNPVSLKMSTGKLFDLNKCLSQLAYDLDVRYMKLNDGYQKLIREEYISHLYRINEWHTYKDISGKWHGMVKSVSEQGKLQIVTKQGIINEYSFKEVEFIP